MNENALLNERIALVERQSERMQGAIDSIAKSLQQTSDALNRLVVLEERHQEMRANFSRNLDRVGKLEERANEIERAIPDELELRLRTAEAKIPSLVETRTWMITSIGAIALAMFSLALKVWLVK